jgi:hypothetical protein
VPGVCSLRPYEKGKPVVRRGRKARSLFRDRPVAEAEESRREPATSVIPTLGPPRCGLFGVSCRRGSSMV